jgi:hypothetical protein
VNSASMVGLAASSSPRSKSLNSPRESIFWLYSAVHFFQCSLYVYGYDSPEAYAIEKDGKMFYAFYSPKADEAWKGKIELRGLAAGKYRVHDYANDKGYSLKLGI